MEFLQNFNQETINHTNTLLSVADKYAIVCLDAISDPNDKKKVVSKLEST